MSISSSFDTKSITLSTPFNFNTKNTSVHRISKKSYLCHGAAFTSLMCCMVVVSLYLPIHVNLVTNNAVTAVLSFCDGLFLRT